MGLLDKIMVWKKKEPLPSLESLGKEEPFGNLRDTDIGAGLAPPFGSEMPGESSFSGTPSFSQEPSFQPRSPYPTQPSTPAFAQASPARDMELMSSKLDTIKAMLDNINQRLANLERIAKEGI